MDIDTLADLMGRKDIRMLRRYAHIGPVHLASAVGKLEESYRAYNCTITAQSNEKGATAAP